MMRCIWMVGRMARMDGWCAAHGWRRGLDAMDLRWISVDMMGGSQHSGNAQTDDQ